MAARGWCGIAVAREALDSPRVCALHERSGGDGDGAREGGEEEGLEVHFLRDGMGIGDFG